MRPRDVFGVAVRAIGVWLLWLAVYWASYVIWKYNGGPSNPNIPIGEDVAEFLFHLIPGLVLLFLADHIVRLAYGPQIRTKLPEAAADPSTVD